MALDTPDANLRSHIDAVKEYLRAAGFRNVGDHPGVNGYAHIIIAAKGRGKCVLRLAHGPGKCVLRLAYGWLAKNSPDDLRAFLARCELAERMLTDGRFKNILIAPGGVIWL